MGDPIPRGEAMEFQIWLSRAFYHRSSYASSPLTWHKLE